MRRTDLTAHSSLVQPSLDARPAEGAAPMPSFPAFFDEHAAFVWRSLRHLGTRDADVPDLAQEVFLIAHAKREQLRDTAGARSWLFRISFGVVRNHLRRAQVRREVPTDPLAEAGIDRRYPAGDPVEQDETRRFLAAVLDRLDPDKRAVLVAQAIEEMSMREIADAFSIPLNQLASHYTSFDPGRVPWSRVVTPWIAAARSASRSQRLQCFVGRVVGSS